MSLVAFLICLVALLIAQADKALAAPDDGTIGIVAYPIEYSSAEYGCLVGLKNRSTKSAIESLTMRFIDRGRLLFAFGPINLAPEQAAVVEQRLESQRTCSGSDVFFRVSFTKDGVRNDLLIASGQDVSASPSARSGISGQVLTWVLTLLAAGVGALLTHRFAITREHEKDRLSWRIKLFESAQPAVREFLNGWGARPEATMLHQYFTELRRKVDLELSIVVSYHEAYQVLADQNVSAERKREAAQKLDQRIRAFMEGLDPYKA